MKTQFKNPINNFAPIFLMLMAMFVLGFGCNTSKPTPDPLAGWKSCDGNHLDKAIIDDYKDFIAKNKLDPLGAVTGFYEDGTGQHAVEFEAFPPNENATWHYVLIYDKENKRIKEIKYDYRKFQS